MERHGQHHQDQHQDDQDYQDYSDVKTYLSWFAAGRPFHKKDRTFYITVILIVMLVELILFLFSQYAFMMVVVALAFLTVVLYMVPPKDFHYRISSEGIKIEDHFYIWSELYDFYFKMIDGTDTLIVRTEGLPGEIKITLGKISRDHARRVLMQFLPFREYMKPTFVEKSADWLSRNFPLDKS